MKICPFISHMIGEDRTDILQIDASSKSSSTRSAMREKDAGADVVVLGFDGDAAVGVRTKPVKPQHGTNKETTSVPSHLFCLKETCRFFIKQDGSCKFDSTFALSQEHSRKIEQVERQAKRIETVESRLDGFNKLDQLDKLDKLDKLPTIDTVDQILKKITNLQEELKKADSFGIAINDDKTVAKVAKELDKFWKFQTKSVSELIASLGDTEKKQESTLSELRALMDNSLRSHNKDGGLRGVEDIKHELTKLREAIQSRDDSIENFSTTVSELVMNIDDTVNVIQGRNDDLTERLDKMDSTLSNFDKSMERLEQSIAKTVEPREAQDISKYIGALDDKLRSRFDDFTTAHKRISEELATFRDQIEVKSGKGVDRDDSWLHTLKAIEQKQSEVIDLVRRNREHSEDDTVQLRKKEAKKFNNLGVTSFHNGEYELARDQFLEAVDLDPEFAESWNNLGLVYSEMGNDTRASEAFSTAIDINPDLPAAYNNLGYIYYKQESFAQAVEMYGEAINRSPQNSSAYTNMGNAYFKLGNRMEARGAWEKALEIDPTNEKASRNLDQLDKE